MIYADSDYRYQDLVNYLSSTPIKDSKKWIEGLLQHKNPELRMVALRIMEVRKAYLLNDFDFEKLSFVARDQITKENNAIMTSTMNSALDNSPSSGSNMQWYLRCSIYIHIEIQLRHMRVHATKKSLIYTTHPIESHYTMHIYCGCRLGVDKASISF